MNLRFLVSIFSLFIFMGCSNDDVETEMALVAFPQTISVSDLRSSVEVESPKSIETAGKIYAYRKFLFVVETNKGIHVIDNSNPNIPAKNSFISIPAVRDISVKADYLYADSAIDLLVFDISDINSISLVERLEDVFTIYNYEIPLEAEFVNFDSFDFQNDIIVGWELKMENKKPYEDQFFTLTEQLSSADFSAVGQGGSLARFQIVNNYLYTVGNFDMTVFDIENLDQPVSVGTQYLGWEIETMFQAEGHLYLGGTNGMYIYSLEAPNAPTFISEFTHWEGCDPVVVDGDFAYLTLRGGNACGVQESVLEVIDISDKSSPFLVNTYSMGGPYGLGFRGDDLFVCDGESGMKIFDKSDPTNLVLKNNFDDILAKDIIPLEHTLIVMSDSKIYQYQYENNSLELLSVFQVN